MASLVSQAKFSATKHNQPVRRKAPLPQVNHLAPRDLVAVGLRGGGQAVDPISTINAAIGAMIASAGGSVAALGAVQMDDGTRQMLMSHAVTLRTMSQAILDAIGG